MHPEVATQTMDDALNLDDLYLGEATRIDDAASVSGGIQRAEALRVWPLTHREHPEILPTEILRQARITALHESPTANAAIAIFAKHG